MFPGVCGVFLDSTLMWQLADYADPRLPSQFCFLGGALQPGLSVEPPLEGAERKTHRVKLLDWCKFLMPKEKKMQRKNLHDLWGGRNVNGDCGGVKIFIFKGNILTLNQLLFAEGFGLFSGFNSAATLLCTMMLFYCIHSQHATFDLEHFEFLSESCGTQKLSHLVRHETPKMFRQSVELT